jgi:hypothetical protein
LPYLVDGETFGARPTSIDGATHGFTANIYFYDIETPIRSFLTAQENLVAHCETIHVAVT